MHIFFAVENSVLFMPCCSRCNEKPICLTSASTTVTYQWLFGQRREWTRYCRLFALCGYKYVVMCIVHNIFDVLDSARTHNSTSSYSLRYIGIFSKSTFTRIWRAVFWLHSYNSLWIIVTFIDGYLIEVFTALESFKNGPLACISLTHEWSKHFYVNSYWFKM